MSKLTPEQKKEIKRRIITYHEATRQIDQIMKKLGCTVSCHIYGSNGDDYIADYDSTDMWIEFHYFFNEEKEEKQ